MQQQFTHAPLLALLGTALGVAPALRGTTLEQLDLDELIHGSTAVVRAKVSGSTAVRRQNDVFTIYKLDVMEQWKSQPGSNAPLEVAVPGGVAGGIRQMVSGAPLLHPGEEYVLFLWQGRSGLIQLMGLSQGLFRVIHTRNRRGDLASSSHRPNARPGGPPCGTAADAVFAFRSESAHAEQSGARRGITMRISKRILLGLAALAALAPLASAYYYWTFFPGPAGSPAIPGRFDLAALKDNTVQYFISDQGPGTLVGSDSTNAIFGQIQQAAQIWNSVPTSELRLAFGGIAPAGVPQVTPGIDVVFDDDMPPGILAQTIPTFPADLSFLSGDPAPAFVPLLRAKLQLRSDLAGASQASFSDAFFLTLVHEFGHTVGLQHTLTSAVMSTSVTRGTLRGTPLAPDDIAAVSLLYPVGGYIRNTGSISGRVTLSGAGVNLASVVALSASGAAISALTSPDGTYRIDGIPPGSYYVYAHPLPPALTGAGEHAPANITVPVDPQGDVFNANIGFAAQFYPGTRDWTQAKQVSVGARAVTDKINFAVTARAGPAVHSMETFGYQGQNPVAAPPVEAQTNGIAIVFFARGATVAAKANDGQQVAPGLGVSVIGGAAKVEAGSLGYFTQGFLQMAIDTASVGAPTPVALAVTLDNDLYVLPSAFTVMPGGPPSIESVTPSVTDQGALSATITGQNLTGQTRILIDGIPAPVTAVGDDGSLAVAPGPAVSGLSSTVEAVNGDGQSSLQALAISPSGSEPRALFNYPFTDASSIGVTPSFLTAGHDTWVAIKGVHTHFASGATAVGFGLSDIYARRVFVASPILLLVNVSVGAGAQVGTTNLTVATGLESITAPGAITLLAPVNPASLRLPVVSASTGLAGVAPGDTASVATMGIDANAMPLDSWRLYVAGEPANFAANANGTLTAQIPPDLAPGPQIMQLISPNGVPLAPVLVNLNPPPPVITGAFRVQPDGTLTALTADAPAHPGDTLRFAVQGLGNASGSAIWFNLGPVSDGDTTHAGVNYPAQGTAPSPDDRTLLVQLQLPQDFSLDPAAPVQLPVMVGTGTLLSAAFNIPLAAPAQ